MELTTEYYDERQGKPVTIDFRETPYVFVKGGATCDRYALSLFVSCISETLRGKDSRDGAYILQTIGKTIPEVRLSVRPEEIESKDFKDSVRSSLFAKTLENLLGWFDKKGQASEIPADPISCCLYCLDDNWQKELAPLFDRLLTLKGNFPEANLGVVVGYRKPLPFAIPGNSIQIDCLDTPFLKCRRKPSRSFLLKIANDFKERRAILNRTVLHCDLQIPYDEIPPVLYELFDNGILSVEDSFSPFCDKGKLNVLIEELQANSAEEGNTPHIR